MKSWFRLVSDSFGLVSGPIVFILIEIWKDLGFEKGSKGLENFPDEAQKSDGPNYRIEIHSEPIRNFPNHFGICIHTKSFILI